MPTTETENKATEEKGYEIMCNFVCISTDSTEDLSKRNSDLVRFAKIDESNNDPCTSMLEFPNKWYVGSQSVCSCTFRHLMPCNVEDIGCREPEDWCPEAKENVEATRELYRTLSFLLKSGYQVDLVDRWLGSELESIKTIEVSLDEISERKFILFEDYKFRLKMSR